MEEVISLNDKFKQFIINIDLKFSFKSKFCVDFMDYFPLLKDGETIGSTIIYVVYSYLRMIVELNMKDVLFLDYFNADIKDYLPNKRLITGKIDHSLDYDVIKKLCMIVSQNSQRIILDDEQIELLEKEKSLSICLEKGITHWVELHNYQHPSSYVEGNLLNILHIFCEIETSLFFKLLHDDTIRLLCYIIKNDITEIMLSLYVDGICSSLNDIYDFASRCYSLEYIDPIQIVIGAFNALNDENIKDTCLPKILEPNELQIKILNLINININNLNY